MPKHEITIEEAKVPAELKQFYKDGKVTFWVGENGEDLKLAGELNPILETHKNTIIGEKRDIEAKYEALKTTVGNDTLNTAQIVLENTKLKATQKTPEETELLESFKTVFPNMQPSEVKTKLPTLVDASTKVEHYEKRDKQDTLFNASGFKEKTVFIDLLNNPDKMKGIKGEPFVEDVDGKKILFANVEAAGGVTEKKNFGEWAAASETWKPYLSALGVKTPDNQTWIQTNPITDNSNPVPEWKRRTDEANKAATQAPSIFAPPSQVTNQGNQQ